MRAAELHVAGIVVHAAPRRLEGIAAGVAALPGAQVHATSGAGRLVVTLEAESADAMTAAIGRIQHLEGVLSAALVWQGADSLARMNEEIPNAEA
jgi:periplasmic nitrate reductase NapD